MLSLDVLDTVTIPICMMMPSEILILSQNHAVFFLTWYAHRCKAIMSAVHSETFSSCLNTITVSLYSCSSLNSDHKLTFKDIFTPE